MPLHLIPGLGATPDLYAGYDFPFPTRLADYAAPPHPACTFAEYAEFMIQSHGIQPGDSIIGVSLGGMMACEISKRIPIRQITLISSCTHSRQLQPLLTRMSFLGPHLPWPLFRRIARPLPGLSPARRQAVQMFQKADSDFVRWACTHAAHWQGLTQPHPDLVSIHGDRDPVFPVGRQKIHHLIPGGDHLMVISRRDEILPLLLDRHL